MENIKLTLYWIDELNDFISMNLIWDTNITFATANFTKL